MNLEGTTSLTLTQTARESGITRDEDAQLRCQSAKKLEDEGNYEGARAALGDLWQGFDQRPQIDGLDEATQAEVLLHAGTIAGWLGRTRQLEGVQETAKDFIFESARTFERLGLADKLVDAQIQLSLCYWREGALDEARVTLHELLSKLPERNGEQKLRVLANLAIVERTANRYREAFRIQTEAAPLLEHSNNHLLRGNFHNEFGLVLKNLAKSEGRHDYIDRAFIEFTAASYHWDLAGNAGYVALVENNLGSLLLTAGKLVEAHQHLNRARALFSKLRDKGSIAQVDETRARVFLAEEHYTQAEIAVRGSVRIFEEGDEKSLFAEALTTHGTTLARLGRYERAAGQFQKAMEVAQQAGAPEMEGIAALTMLEELSGSLPLEAMRESFQSAESLLAQTKDPGVDHRLAQCARTILRAEQERGALTKHSKSASEAGNRNSDSVGPAESHASPAEPWTGCALETEVLNYEGHLIKRALEAANGSVTRAARMLGITHQGLAFILNGRHKTLLNVRTPVRHRRRSILRAH
jgi:tetratricopeptide (TPR) repeat protein